MNYKLIASQEHISLATAYRYYPIERPPATQAQAVTLRLQGCSIRRIAFILGIDKMRVWRWLNA